MIIFTTCKPNVDGVRARQENAIRSWLKIGLEVIIIGEEEGIEEMAEELGCRYIPHVERGPNGVPLVSSVFDTAEQETDEDVLCYVNSDIILTPEWLRVIRENVDGKDEFMITGFRREVDLGDESLEFGPGWARKLREDAIEHPIHKHARDYFVFSRGLWDEIPPFEIGRFLWDAWLCKRTGGNTIGLKSKHKICFHQIHEDLCGDKERKYNKKVWEDNK